MNGEMAHSSVQSHSTSLPRNSDSLTLNCTEAPNSISFNPIQIPKIFVPLWDSRFDDMQFGEGRGHVSVPCVNQYLVEGEDEGEG